MRTMKIRETGRVWYADDLSNGIGCDDVVTFKGSFQLFYDKYLGFQLSLSEHKTHWKTIFKSLKEQGMYRVNLIISDNN